VMISRSNKLGFSVLQNASKELELGGGSFI
jgi:hypothetical protein